VSLLVEKTILLVVCVLGSEVYLLVFAHTIPRQEDEALVALPLNFDEGPSSETGFVGACRDCAWCPVADYGLHGAAALVVDGVDFCAVRSGDNGCACNFVKNLSDAATMSFVPS